MDSAQHCLDQSAECRRLMKLAQSEAEAEALKNLCRTWVGLAAGAAYIKTAVGPGQSAAVFIFGRLSWRPLSFFVEVVLACCPYGLV